MSKKTPSGKAPSSFEEAMVELQQLVSNMEKGELPLDASVLAYQRGAELVQYCTAQLDRVEQQVKVVEADLVKSYVPGDGI